MCVFVPLSDDVTASKWDFFEGRSYSGAPALTVDSFRGGEFQDGVERCLSERVPRRSKVLLANANAQRWLIELAKLPFGYDAYPTFFGSSYLDCRSEGAVYQVPLKRADYDRSWFEGVGSWCEGLVAKSPESRWMMILPERSNVASSMPAASLVSGHADWSYFADGLSASLPECVQVANKHASDLREHQRLYFRTDHHWQIQGALEAYDYIVSEPDAGRRFGEPFAASADPFFGSGARVGLCPDAFDQLYDVDFVQGDLTVTVDGKPSSASALGGYGFRSESYSKSGNKFADMYDAWFHNNYGTIEVVNNDLPEDAGSVLVIGDSYSNSLTRLLAGRYRNVYDADPRQYKGDLGEYVAEKNADVAVFVMCAETLSGISR